MKFLHSDSTSIVVLFRGIAPPYDDRAHDSHLPGAYQFHQQKSFWLKVAKVKILSQRALEYSKVKIVFPECPRVKIIFSECPRVKLFSQSAPELKSFSKVKNVL